MIAKIAGLFLTAAFAFGQTDRTFHFEQTSSPQDMKEVATAVRTIADISQVSLDEAKQTLALHGTAEQLGLAEWMFNELDAPNPQSEAVRQYKMQSGDDNTVRIFYVRNAPTIQDFQEVATVARTGADIRRVFAYNAPRAVIVRGTPDQVALGVWIAEQLDQPADQQAPPAEYRLPTTDDPRGEEMIRILRMGHAQTIQELQEAATAVRTIGDIRDVFTYGRARALVVRSTPEQVALAQWLVARLDESPSEAARSGSRSSEIYEYDNSLPEGQNMVRVFYAPQIATVRDFQRLAARVRRATGMQRFFTYNELRAMAVRGTIDQVATAERMVNALKQP